jgi:hypothetical protein
MAYEYAPIPFVIPANREAITEEPDRHGHGRSDEFPRDADWIGWENMGGGHSLPEDGRDYLWPTNPKEEIQEVGGYG